MCPLIILIPINLMTLILVIHSALMLLMIHKDIKYHHKSHHSPILPLRQDSIIIS